MDAQKIHEANMRQHEANMAQHEAHMNGEGCHCESGHGAASASSSSSGGAAAQARIKELEAQVRRLQGARNGFSYGEVAVILVLAFLIMHVVRSFLQSESGSREEGPAQGGPCLPSPPMRPNPEEVDCAARAAPTAPPCRTEASG